MQDDYDDGLMDMMPPGAPATAKKAAADDGLAITDDAPAGFLVDEDDDTEEQPGSSAGFTMAADEDDYGAMAGIGDEDVAVDDADDDVAHDDQDEDSDDLRADLDDRAAAAGAAAAGGGLLGGVLARFRRSKADPAPAEHGNRDGAPAAKSGGIKKMAVPLAFVVAIGGVFAWKAGVFDGGAEPPARRFADVPLPGAGPTQQEAPVPGVVTAGLPAGAPGLAPGLVPGGSPGLAPMASPGSMAGLPGEAASDLAPVGPMTGDVGGGIAPAALPGGAAFGSPIAGGAASMGAGPADRPQVDLSLPPAPAGQDLSPQPFAVTPQPAPGIVPAEPVMTTTAVPGGATIGMDGDAGQPVDLSLDRLQSMIQEEMGQVSLGLDQLDRNVAALNAMQGRSNDALTAIKASLDTINNQLSRIAETQVAALPVKKPEPPAASKAKKPAPLKAKKPSKPAAAKPAPKKADARETYMVRGAVEGRAWVTPAKGGEVREIRVGEHLDGWGAVMLIRQGRAGVWEIVTERGIAGAGRG